MVCRPSAMFSLHERSREEDARTGGFDDLNGGGEIVRMVAGASYTTSAYSVPYAAEVRL